MKGLDSIEEWGKSWRELAQKLEAEKVALIRRVERLTDALKEAADDLCCCPSDDYHEPKCGARFAFKALKEESDADADDNRRVERLTAALRHYESQWVIGPFGERVDIGHVAREALFKEKRSPTRLADARGTKMDDNELEKEAEATADEIIAECRNCTVCASPLDHVRRHLVSLYMNASFKEHR